ncbi:hypothetical protein Ato02nite_058210 [Paractinoplanes toevensis]|uniref:Uncharacterized protein n=1 Tax=Paractinoplanes toevensis TaxID=571911 RepID=A0A919TEA3_9ACTN|nr:hypothetical protein Ato02nite_058210 [Actinoplanes toevensis]
MAESATECTPSASIDAEPVIAAATNFATPIARFALNAVSTALVLPSLAIAPFPLLINNQCLRPRVGAGPHQGALGC